MKYLKNFESLYTHYNIGDYIYVNGITFQDDKSRAGKIIDVDTLGWYLVEFIDITNKFVRNHVSYIDRELTTDEIKQYELEKNINKYNL